MTIRLILKALMVVWPFMRDAIFKDRTVREVIRENWHMNGMFFLVSSLVLILWFATHAALTARTEVARLQTVIDSQPVCMTPEAQDTRRRRLIDLLK